MSTTEQDIIIVGGGISGAALAYGLSGKGRKVTVLDAPTDTNKASRTNVGLIWCQSKFLHLPEYAKWGFVSSRLYPALTKELEEISGHAIPVNYTGGIIPVLSEEDYQKRGDYIEKLREALGEYKGIEVPKETVSISKAEVDAELARMQERNARIETVDREAKTGLYVYEADGELLVFRDRGTHYILNFFLQQGARPTLPDVSKPVVTELAYRPKDADAMLSAAAYFRAIGFEEVLRRTRRTRSGASAGVQRASQQAASASRSGVSAGAAAGEAAVMDFLKQEFSTFTGCLPTEDTLREALAAGQILCAQDERGICGLLHFAPGRAASELRHLAVRADCRRQGIANALFDAYMSVTGGQKSLVWARIGNEAAERFYETHDYRPDGWNSVVLQYGGTEQ